MAMAFNKTLEALWACPITICGGTGAAAATVAGWIQQRDPHPRNYRRRMSFVLIPRAADPARDDTVQGVRGGIGSKTLGDDQWGGTTMRSSARDDRMPPRRFDAARVELRCRVNAAHARQLILEHATIYTDGWASWAEDGHIYTGFVQTGPCCDPPEVSAL